MPSAELQRLLQAVEHFQSRTKGAELPKGVSEALQGLQKAAGTPQPTRDTPGAREAMKASGGTRGTGEHFSVAATGPDGPSPGQREAQGSGGVSKEIHEAAAAIVANAQK